MKTNRMMNVAMTLAAIGASTVAWAGKEVGNGGGAFVCRDASGKITSAELVDLFVGRSRYGLKIERRALAADESVEAVTNELLEGAISRIAEGNESLARSIRENVRDVQKRFRLIDEQSLLVQFDDAYQPIVKRGCPREQLANYTNTHEFLVDPEIWNALAPTDRAALLLHEAVYLRHRERGATDSRHAIFLVARAFSDLRFEPYKKGLPREYIECFAEDAPLDQRMHMVLYLDQENGATLQLLWAHGLDVPSRMAGTVHPITVESIRNFIAGRDTLFNASAEVKGYFVATQGHATRSMGIVVASFGNSKPPAMYMDAVDPITGKSSGFMKATCSVVRK